MLLAASVVSADEVWLGNYAPERDPGDMPLRMEQRMQAHLPQFLCGQDKVKMIVAGKVDAVSPCTMDGRVAVVEIDQGGRPVTFSDDDRSLIVNGEDGARYLRQ